MKKNKKLAFTLIELLVVIAIIGILSTLAVVALQSARGSARDAKRVSDVKQMQTALELYFNDNGSYPTSIASTIATSGVVYMNTVPTAPTPVDGSCTDTNNAYTYSSDGSTYSIYFCLGGGVSNITSGQKVATRDGVADRVWACGEILTDSRDSQQYPTVLIGSQCWMAKNMNYDNGCSSNSWSTTVDNGWCGCYNDTASNCTTYGKLYQWKAVMANAVSERAQGICPTGWHVPSIAELNSLYSTVNVSTYRCNGVNGNIAKALASTSSLWLTNAGTCVIGNTLSTNNATGFSLLPGGAKNHAGQIGTINQGATLWSSTYNSGGGTVYYHAFTFALSYVLNTGSVYAHQGLSVRCLKD